MAITDKKTSDENNAAYAAEFDAADAPPKPAQTDDEAFGLAPEPAPAATDSGTGEGAAAAPAEAAAEPAAAAAPSEDEQRLREREAALEAREAELAQREAAMATTNVDESETTAPAGDGDPAGAAAAGEGDPGAALADDFGPEFVKLLSAFIKQECGQMVSSGMDGVTGNVNQVIHALRTDIHLGGIAAAHEDFMEIVESPEFAAYQDALPPEKQAEVARVIEKGSAKEIINALTEYKKSKEGAGNGGDEVDENALDAAAGVRSSGLKLPTDPSDASSYADAWAKA